VLIQAGVDPNVKDNSGWTPHIHAVFRGHTNVKEILRPLTAFQEPSPLFSTLTNAEISNNDSKSSNKLKGASAELAYGHKYLQEQSLIIVTLGNTDTRKRVNPVELYNTHISSILIPSTSVSLVVSAKNATGEPAIIDLPINNTSAVDPIMFYSSNIEEVILTFDITPTYETKKQFIGRAIALLSSVKTSSGPQHSSLMGTVTVPILSTNSLDVIGRIVFEFLVIKPFKHNNLAVGSKHTYWTSTKVIGHRGSGMNRAETPNLQIGENTLISFITAASLGAEYVEFDVQLTKDHVPVIYHDWTITETGYDIPIHAITLQQFLKINKQRFVPEEFLIREHNIRKEFLRPSNNDGTNQKKDNREKKRRSHSVPVNTLIHSEKKEGKIKGNSDGTIQAPFATLVETFKVN
jgi:glycerophosphodiester phosphodiesterase